MPRRAIWATVWLCGGMAASGCCAGGWGAGAAGPGRGGVPTRQALSAVGLTYYWAAPLRLDRGERVETLYHVGENVYALTNDNRLAAFDAASGVFKWQAFVADRGQRVFAPAHADNVVLPPPSIATIQGRFDAAEYKPANIVVVNTMTAAVLLDRATGAELRRLKFELFVANSAVAADAAHLYVGSSTGRYYCLRLVDGIEAWKRSTGDVISARPVLFNRKLFVASQDKRAYCVDPYVSTDQGIWSQQTDGAITADIAVNPRGVFVPSRDHSLYAYDVLSGVELWQFRARTALTVPAEVGARSVFLYAPGDTFYAVDLANGQKRWSLNAGRRVVGATEQQTYIVASDNTLLAVDEMSGQLDKALPMGALRLFVPNAQHDAIFAATSDGRFFCIRPADAPPLSGESFKPAGQ